MIVFFCLLLWFATCVFGVTYVDYLGVCTECIVLVNDGRYDDFMRTVPDKTREELEESEVIQQIVHELQERSAIRFLSNGNQPLTLKFMTKIDHYQYHHQYNKLEVLQSTLSEHGISIIICETPFTLHSSYYKNIAGLKPIHYNSNHSIETFTLLYSLAPVYNDPELLNDPEFLNDDHFNRGWGYVGDINLWCMKWAAKQRDYHATYDFNTRENIKSRVDTINKMFDAMENVYNEPAIRKARLQLIYDETDLFPFTYY